MPNVVQFSAILTMNAQSFLRAVGQAQSATDQLAGRVQSLGTTRGPSRLAGAIRGVGRALRDILVIAAGINLASIFWRARQAVGAFIRSSIEATGTLQAIQLQIRGLQARELAGLIESSLEAATVWRTDFRDGTTKARIDTEKLRDALGSYQDILRQVDPELARLMDSQERYATIQRDSARMMYTGNQLFEASGEKAAETVNKLRRMAIISPLSVQTTMDLFRLASAFQFNTEESMRMTRGMLNVAAGLGATTEQTERMMFNFAQIRMQGKIMARDFWELGKAGFDLYGVLKQLSKQTGYNIRTHQDFNALIRSGRLTWEDFVRAFETMAEKQFGGAAKRMAFTLQGLKSTIKDVFILTVPEVLMPVVELLGKYAEGIIDKLLAFAESGKLKEVGQKWAERFEVVLRALGFKLPPPEIPDNLEDEDVRLAYRLGELYADEVIQGAEDTMAEKVGAIVEGFKQSFETGIDAAALVGLIPDDLAKKITDLADAWERFKTALGGFTEEVFAPFVEGLGSIGEALSGIEVDPLTDITNALNSMAEFFEEHEDLIPFVQDFIKALGVALTLAAVPGILTGIAVAIESISVALLGLATNPLFLLVLALTALFTVIRTFGPQALETLRMIFAIIAIKVLEVRAKLWDAVGSIATWFETFLSKLASFLETLSLLPGIEIPQALIDGLNSAADAAGALADKAEEAQQNLIELQKNVPEAYLGGSPSPLAIGLDTAAKAMHRLTRETRPLTRALVPVGVGTNIGGGTTKQIRIDQVNITSGMDERGFKELLRQALT